MSSPVELIAQSALFSGLTPQHRDQIAAHLTRHEIPANTEIVRQGDAADALFLIESGLVAVLMRDAKLGIVRVVQQLTPPQSFGETALITTGTRNSSCMALEPTVVYHGNSVALEAVPRSQRRPACPIVPSVSGRGSGRRGRDPVSRHAPSRCRSSLAQWR